MPIKDLTERRRLPRLGKIHLGVKVLSAKGTEYPSAVDYFVCPEEVQAIYGLTPRSLDIAFPVEDETVFASQFYRAYSRTRGLVCKGNGDQASRLIDVATRQGEEGTGVVTGDIANAKATQVEWVEDIVCPGQACPYYQQKQCREIMNLQFLLPRVPGLGVWQLDTSSYNSIVNVNSALALVRQVFGGVAMVPLLLTVEPLGVTVEGKLKKVYVLNIRARQTLAQLAALKRDPLQALLPPGDGETPELLFPTSEERAAQAEAEPQHTGGASEPQGDIVPQDLNSDSIAKTPQAPVPLPRPQEAPPKPDSDWAPMPKCWEAVKALGGKPLDFLKFLGVPNFNAIKDVGAALAEYAKALGKPAPEWQD